ncbi:PEP/pyruvate-binding domain-containing protein, partial [Polaribacter sp. 11A2H]
MKENILSNLKTYAFKEVTFDKLMQNRINKVLIVCSNYDFYMLEEDGRIEERIFNEYTSLNLRHPPNFIHANSAKRAIKMMETHQIDIVITWLDIGNYNAFETSKKIKEAYPNVPIAALSHHSSQLRSKLQKENTDSIDFVFHWNGNADIFLAIIKLTEDRMNAEVDINTIGVKAILLVEDSLKFYSRYIPLIYKVILKQTQGLMSEGLNEHRKMLLMRGRPKILLATTFEEGIELFDTYKENLLGVISDVNYFKDGVRNKEAGFLLLDYVRKYKRYFPFLMQSSNENNERRTLELKGKFLYKHSETLGVDIKNYIIKYFAFGDFEFWDPTQMKVLATAKDLGEFQRAIKKVTEDCLMYHAKRSEFSKWLKSRALFPLADLLSVIEYDEFENNGQIRDFLLNSIKSYLVYRSRGVIVKFNKDKYDEFVGYARIGEGALGGKARGLAFIDSFLKRNNLYNKYKNVSITIPRTVVISTEVFDQFIETHKLIKFAAKCTDDDKILNEFISKDLPEWALEDIRAFLKTTTCPIAVRSSSMLEDSNYQPFAGVFATYM